MTAPDRPPTDARGLTQAEAAARLQTYGPNAVTARRHSPLLAFAAKLSGPVPWMLEAALVLEAVLGKWVEAVVIATLLVLNATLSFRQESRARAALDTLRTRLQINARVLRDGSWGTVPADSVVPGDVLRLRVGDVVPADLRLLEGTILADQSALTGESKPVDLERDAAVYSGALVKRGEATGLVVATGARSYFGKTAELVRVAHARGHLEELMAAIVRYLLVIDVALVGLVFAEAFLTHRPLHEVLPFSLVLLIASVPVALPATFTLATALASLDLAEQGVLVARLQAIEDAASMTVLCSDKTGTLTENRLSLARVIAFSQTEDEVLSLAALASDAATQDPIDLAILERVLGKRHAERVAFVPFDPSTKRSEAELRTREGSMRVVKGAPSMVATLAEAPPDFEREVARLASAGWRVIAVAAGPTGALRLVGLVALADPPRPDSKAVIAKLRSMGIRVVIVTGDAAATATSLAREVGLGAETVGRGEIEARAASADVFAGVFPEDKFALVQALQRAGSVVGMTGDGVNDAPALKQAEVGIAVMTATDVAKSAASFVLTRSGLAAAPALVEEGRRVYQRMLTWTLNKLVKTLEVSLLLTLGLVATGVFLTTPRHILLLVFTNDFVTMSLASDRVTPSARPDRWNVRALITIGAVVAASWLAFSWAAVLVGRTVLHTPLPQLQTLVFVVLVFTGQASIYMLRERRSFWHSRPSNWLLAASLVDLVIVGVMAVRGFLISPVPASVVLAVLASVVCVAVMLDQLKVVLLRHLPPAGRAAQR